MPWSEEVRGEPGQLRQLVKVFKPGPGEGYSEVRFIRNLEKDEVWPPVPVKAPALTVRSKDPLELMKLQNLNAPEARDSCGRHSGMGA